MSINEKISVIKGSVLLFKKFFKFLKIIFILIRYIYQRGEITKGGGDYRIMTSEKYKLIIQQYEKLVFNICLQLVRDYHEAQNLTQDTFISAYNSIDRCPEENLKPWLARIATNKAKDYLKSAYARKVDLKEEYEENLLTTDCSPEKIYIAKEGEETIKRKIESLKEPYLKVSVMYFIEEKTVDEIAKVLDRPKKTVQTQLLRAKTILQKVLKEEYDGRVV